MSEDLPALFGQRVRSHRLRLGISQETLANLCGLHRTYIGGIEQGRRNPSLINIGKIAKALEIPPDDLFRDDQNQLEKSSLRKNVSA